MRRLPAAAGLISQGRASVAVSMATGEVLQFTQSLRGIGNCWRTCNLFRLAYYDEARSGASSFRGLHSGPEVIVIEESARKGGAREEVGTTQGER